MNSQEKRFEQDPLRFVEELKRRWLATIDALADPLIFVRTDYRIEKVNRALAKFAGQRDIRTMIGKKCYEVFANKKRPCDGCLLEKTLEEGARQTFELRDIRKHFFFEVSSQPAYGKDGQIEGCVHVYRDRTEARALQEQLLQSEKLASIGLLAGGIAHEINNPLGGILIFSQMILRELPVDSPFLEDVKEIESAAQRCKSIVERLLDFARSRPADLQSGSLCAVDMTDAARSALRFARVLDSAKKVDITEEWSSEPMRVLGEQNKFIQLFLNLIQNAFQAMPDGGSLKLSSALTRESGRVSGVWEIRDTGVGIAREHQTRIFDPFFTTKEPGEGTGLGLSICYGICKEAGGTLEVDSGPDDGTCFRIRLPLCS